MKTHLRKTFSIFSMGLLSLVFSTSLMAQSFVIDSPAGIAGAYLMEPAAFGADLVSGLWTGELEFVNDTTAAAATPEEGCNGPLENDLTSKIAVIDRGSCQFGDKCLNAENAGAIAVVVCNNATGAPIAMGAGNNGASVTIPCLMISKDDCDVIRSTIMAGGVMATLGNIVFDNDLSISTSNVILAPSYVVPASQVQTANDFIVYGGARVANIGAVDQPNVTLTGDIDLGGSNVYSESTTFPNLPAGTDTLLLFPTTYDASAGGAGVYGFDYTISSDSTDQSPNDNTVNSGFILSDSIFCAVPFDVSTGTPINNNSIRSGDQQDYEWGVMIRMPHGTGLTAIKSSFSFNAGGTSTLAGEQGTMNLYRWDDLNADDDIEDAELVAVGFSPPHTFTTEANFDLVDVELFDFNTFVPGVALEDGKIYLLSVAYNGVNDVFTGYNADANLVEYGIQYEADQGVPYWISPVKTTDWNAVGFGRDFIPGLVLHTTENPVSTTKLPKGNFDLAILSNPVKDQLTVKLGLERISPNVRYEIADMTGRVLYQEDRAEIEQDVFSYNVANFAAGTYMITVKTNQGFRTAKFVVAN